MYMYMFIHETKFALNIEFQTFISFNEECKDEKMSLDFGSSSFDGRWMNTSIE